MDDLEKKYLVDKITNIDEELQVNRKELKKAKTRASILKDAWVWPFCILLLAIASELMFYAPTTVGTITLMIGIPSTIGTAIYSAIRNPLIKRKIEKLINKRDELTVLKDDLIDELAIKEAKEIKVYSPKEVGLEEDLTVSEVSEKELEKTPEYRIEKTKSAVEEFKKNINQDFERMLGISYDDYQKLSPEEQQQLIQDFHKKADNPPIVDDMQEELPPLTVSDKDLSEERKVQIRETIKEAERLMDEERNKNPKVRKLTKPNSKQ